jgi:hypothetical protein
MVWVFVGSVACLFCYVMGYCIGEAVTNDKWRNTRGQMELDGESDIPEECYGCKNVGLPCDPNCQYNVMNQGKELKVKDVESEKNDTQKD